MRTTHWSNVFGLMSSGSRLCSESTGNNKTKELQHVVGYSSSKHLVLQGLELMLRSLTFDYRLLLESL